MNKKIMIYFVFFILLVLKVAAKEDFSVTTQDKIDLCPCSNQGYLVYVQNTGSVTSTYSVSFSGSAAKWVKATPSKFSINPGTISYFFVYVNSDCNIKGSYDLNVFITTSSGLTKAVKQNLSFIECYKFDIDFGNIIELEKDKAAASFSKHTGTYNICEKDKNVLPVLITNKESYANSYILSLKGADWAKLNTDKASLDGNKKGIVLINLNPGEGLEGNYKLKFQAVTELGNARKSKEIDVDVDKCYGLKIDIEKEEDVICDETEYDVKIKNDGKLRARVNLSTNFDWAEFKEAVNNTLTNDTSTKTILFLDGNEEKILKLILKPSIPGVYGVEVKGFVNDSGVKASDKIKINSVLKEDCYRADISIKKINNYYSEEYYSVDVFNKGLKKATYNTSLEAPSWASISPDLLELNTGQKGSLNLYVNPSENVEADNYPLILKLNFDDAAYSKEINVKLIKENKIIKNIENFIRYYQFYIYSIAVILILIFIFIKPIKKQINRIKKKHEGYKIKKEKEKQLEEERKRKEEEKRKSEEEKKAKEEEREKQKEERRKKEAEKKIKAEKKAEKLRKKKIRFLVWFIVLFVLIIIGVLIFLSVYFRWIPKIDFKILSYLGVGLKNVWAYSYYIFIALVFLALIILFFHTLEKEEKKKPKEKEIKKIEEEKKAEKRKKKVKFFKSVYFKIFVVILVLLIAGFVAYYYFYSYVKEFFILYLYYFVIGIIILILIILFMVFYKPIVDFLTGEEK